MFFCAFVKADCFKFKSFPIKAREQTQIARKRLRDFKLNIALKEIILEIKSRTIDT